jgi:hypothetical protein
VQALVCSRYGFRPINTTTAPLAARLDDTFSESSIHLLAGETLFACTAGLLGAGGNETSHRLSQHQLAQLISEALEEDPQQILPMLRRRLTNPPIEADRTALFLSRQ